MKFASAMTVRLSMLGAALLVLAGCAGQPRATDWSQVSLREQHQYMPTLVWDDRPTAVVTAGPGGMVVGTGTGVPAPAAHMVAQDGQIRLVSPQTFATMNANPTTGTMGASPGAAQPAPGAQPAPAR